MSEHTERAEEYAQRATDSFEEGNLPYDLVALMAIYALLQEVVERLPAPVEA